MLSLIMYFILFIVTTSDRLDEFYERTKQADVKICADPHRLYPNCKICIPGLQEGKGKMHICSEFISDSQQIRNEIASLTRERYGANLNPKRPFGLYPYLEKDELIVRQITFGDMLSKRQPKHILDIGAYYNPINLFLDKSYCPASVTIVEPILDPLSLSVPCANNNGSTLFTIVPITFKHYIQIKDVLPPADAVVCIGCDSHYGPNRKMLETTFRKPYILYLEYPSEYVHNAPFKKMMGTAAGEKLTYIHKFQVSTNETTYTKRVMKVIEYSNV